MSDNVKREVGLVSCVKSKRDEPATPRALYTSTYFKKMRDYAEAEHDEWWILSAKHGLLDPDGEPIAPYEETLTNATKSERQEWSERVFAELGDAGLLDEGTRLVFHAGKSYYEALLPILEDSDVTDVQIPTEGLQIGYRLQWYNERL